jgi:hypothetical protein
MGVGVAACVACGVVVARLELAQMLVDHCVSPKSCAASELSKGKDMREWTSRKSLRETGREQRRPPGWA